MIIVSISGITLQALWVRLENRPNFKMRLDEGSQEFLWRCILSIPDLEFYRLPSPRGVLNPKLPIVIDPESGVTVDFVSWHFFLSYQVNELGHLVKMFAFSLPMRKMLVLKIFSLIICMSKSFFAFSCLQIDVFYVYFRQLWKKNYSRIIYTDPITSKVYYPVI